MRKLATELTENDARNVATGKYVTALLELRDFLFVKGIQFAFSLIVLRKILKPFR